MQEAEQKLVICGANSYQKKFYLNPEFSLLPEQIRQELQIMCVMFTEEVGGIFTVGYDGEGNLDLMTESAESDLLYDEIGAGLKIGQMRKEKRELFESLEIFYKVFISKEIGV